MDRIQPWVHYVGAVRRIRKPIRTMRSREILQVPVRVDYADLYDVLAFFDGGFDAARTGNHDDLAEAIAMAGSDWAHGFWRLDDMRACTRLCSISLGTYDADGMFCTDTLRLLLEWARVFDPARKPTAQLELDV